MHKAALQGYGPSAIHRRTWVFMDHYVPWPGDPEGRPPRTGDAVLMRLARRWRDGLDPCPAGLILLAW